MCCDNWLPTERKLNNRSFKLRFKKKKENNNCKMKHDSLSIVQATLFDFIE